MSHVLLGKTAGRHELGMEVQSRRSCDAGSRLGQGVQINISPSQKLLLRSRATSVSALFFMNVSSPSAPATLPFQRPEQTSVYVKYPFLIPVWFSVESKNQKPNIPVIQSLQFQKAPTNRRGFAPRLLCLGLQGCTFAIPLCCWKNIP